MCSSSEHFFKIFWSEGFRKSWRNVPSNIVISLAYLYFQSHTSVSPVVKGLKWTTPPMITTLQFAVVSISRRAQQCGATIRLSSVASYDSGILHRRHTYVLFHCWNSSLQYDRSIHTRKHFQKHFATGNTLLCGWGIKATTGISIHVVQRTRVFMSFLWFWSVWFRIPRINVSSLMLYVNWYEGLVLENDILIIVMYQTHALS